MITLSYGYLKPQTGDKGSVFFPALEADIQQLNDHNHNGVNSAPISAGSIAPVTQALLAANWVASGSGFRQLVLMPGTMQYDNFTVMAKLTATGLQYYPTIIKASINTYYIHINDASLDVTVYYT